MKKEKRVKQVVAPDPLRATFRKVNKFVMIVQFVKAIVVVLLIVVFVCGFIYALTHGLTAMISNIFR